MAVISFAEPSHFCPKEKLQGSVFDCFPIQMLIFSMARDTLIEI